MEYSLETCYGLVYELDNICVGLCLALTLKYP